MRDYPSSLQFVPDWFVARGPIDVWYDGNYWYHDDELIICMKVIKKERLRKERLRKNSCPLPGILILSWISVCQKMIRGSGSKRWLFLKLSDTKITASRYILTLPGLVRLNKMCDLFKNVIQKTCDKAVNINPYFLEIIPDRYKTQGACEKAVKKYP